MAFLTSAQPRLPRLSRRALGSRPVLILSLAAGALTGCTAYVQTEPGVAYSPGPLYEAPPPEPPSPPAAVEITVASDFYQPLESYGTWVDIDGYGRCWQPRNVGGEWRPYSSGQWVSTDAGWCWQSSESFGWATYHYGRWNDDPQRGWYWVPQTQWAPAWVSWREGGGYAGWAPLSSQARPGFNVRVGLFPSIYVFVDERHFSGPIRPSTIIVNNTTIINKTVIINDTHITDNITVNSGPRVATIEKATGQTIKPVPVRQVRVAEEARSAVKPVAGTTTAASQSHPVPRAQAEATATQPARSAASEGRPTEDPKALAAAQARTKADSESKAIAAQKAKADERTREDQKARALSQANTEAKAKPAEARPEESRPSTAQTDAKASTEAKATAEAKAKADATA